MTEGESSFGNLDDSAISHHIIKAQLEGETAFDFSVVNNDLEKAFKELRDYCLSVYWKDYERE